MPALIPAILTASQLVLAADSIPKLDVERTCRPAATAGVLPGRHVSETNKVPAASSSMNGANTALRNAANAQGLPRLIGHRATSNC
jgi:hypothetical protein